MGRKLACLEIFGISVYWEVIIEECNLFNFVFIIASLRSFCKLFYFIFFNFRDCPLPLWSFNTTDIFLSVCILCSFIGPKTTALAKIFFHPSHPRTNFHPLMGDVTTAKKVCYTGTNSSGAFHVQLKSMYLIILQDFIILFIILDFILDSLSDPLDSLNHRTWGSFLIFITLYWFWILVI